MSVQSNVEPSATAMRPCPAVQQGNRAKVNIERSIVDTVERMDALADDPDNEGRTFEVTRPVFEHFFKLLKFLPRPADDISRINNLLGTAFTQEEPGGITRICACEHCGHEFSFADHVQSALRMGVHTREVLKEILAGEKYYLTVDTEKPRAVLCVNCSRITLMAHCCYGGSTYGYA